MEVVNFPNSLESESIGLESSQSFEELYRRLHEQGDIRGTQKSYAATELIKKIEEVRTGERDISYITRSFGLRDTVERLLESDPVYAQHKET